MSRNLEQWAIGASFPDVRRLLLFRAEVLLFFAGGPFLFRAFHPETHFEDSKKQDYEMFRFIFCASSVGSDLISWAM